VARCRYCDCLAVQLVLIWAPESSSRNFRFSTVPSGKFRLVLMNIPSRLTVLRRKSGDTQVNPGIRDFHQETAILRRASFGDIHVRENLGKDSLLR
jgi:hypothetical protein